MHLASHHAAVEGGLLEYTIFAELMDIFIIYSFRIINALITRWILDP